MKRTLACLTCFAIGVTFALAMVYILDVNWERRFVLYHIRNELKKDLSKTEVEEIISRHQASFITRFEARDRINLLVNLGVTDSLSLILSFENDKLNSAVLMGEDHPKDVPKDAPPNLE